jgi:hypothetical protein
VWWSEAQVLFDGKNGENIEKEIRGTGPRKQKDKRGTRFCSPATFNVNGNILGFFPSELVFGELEV